jgi:hypothetical protein
MTRRWEVPALVILVIVVAGYLVFVLGTYVYLWAR